MKYFHSPLPQFRTPCKKSYQAQGKRRRKPKPVLIKGVLILFLLDPVGIVVLFAVVPIDLENDSCDGDQLNSHIPPHALLM